MSRKGELAERSKQTNRMMLEILHQLLTLRAFRLGLAMLQSNVSWSRRAWGIVKGQTKRSFKFVDKFFVPADLFDQIFVPADALDQFPPMCLTSFSFQPMRL